MSQNDVGRLEELEDEQLEQLLEFVESVGGIEEAQAAVDTLSQLRGRRRS